VAGKTLRGCYSFVVAIHLWLLFIGCYSFVVAVNRAWGAVIVGHTAILIVCQCNGQW